MKQIIKNIQYYHVFILRTLGATPPHLDVSLRLGDSVDMLVFIGFLRLDVSVDVVCFVCFALG